MEAKTWMEAGRKDSTDDELKINGFFIWPTIGIKGVLVIKYNNPRRFYIYETLSIENIQFL